MDRTRARRETPLDSPARFRFELMPTEGAGEQAAYLPEGATVAVSCSPAKGIGATLALGEELSGRGFRVVPHLSARLVEGEVHLRSILRRLDEAGIKDVFVVGGDAKEPAGPYEDALALLSAMADLGHGLEQVGITGYPEGHPIIDDAALRRALLDKAPFATYVVTQMCFDPGAILAWVTGIRREGVGLPVYAGISGVIERKKLMRISLKIGVGDSARFLAKHAGLVASLLKSRVYKPDELVEELAPRVGDWDNIAGFHAYTFNQVKGTEEWRRRKSGLEEGVAG